ASIKKKIRKPSWHLLWSQRGTNMSLSQMRPQTSQLLELHVFYVPAEVWNFKLNTVPVALTRKFISAGFIRVSPHITLRVLWERLGEYLGGVTVADKFRFLKCIGKNLAVVKAKQETELELKSFAPPHALYPELYLLPGVEYFEDVYPLLSSPQQKHPVSEEANGFGHGSRLSRLSQQKPEKGKPFLQSIQSRHQVENLEVPSPVEWGEKEPVPVSHTNNKQDSNNRIPEKQFEGKVFKCLLNIIVISLENKMAEQLQQMKEDRRHMENTREKLRKRVKGLLEQNKLRRYHVPEEWKKYFKTKKATVSLEDTSNKQDLELYHQKLLLQLEARDSQKRPNKTTSKNYTIIRIATVQHELHQLRRKLEDTKMRLLIEIKMRKQAASDLRALRAELTQKKIHSALILQSRKSGI
uniref:Spermatosis associated 1 n=1 Tax=Serinus canaria TaxID=9135 RepID=A0A8C9NMM0_SERCA